ncbi:hypothetical protein ElyMa_003640800 [Elysia marginata]|uniref:Uncharacterized protein n=1 Tax=Elysia marginata TaxID=1093978 RepID=A0AAV4EUG3_9GAST|nr:hypothetical protein ElyMa_003640800 [Elysia marginata]
MLNRQYKYICLDRTEAELLYMHHQARKNTKVGLDLDNTRTEAISEESRIFITINEMEETVRIFNEEENEYPSNFDQRRGSPYFRQNKSQGYKDKKQQQQTNKMNDKAGQNIGTEKHSGSIKKAFKSAEEWSLQQASKTATSDVYMGEDESVWNREYQRIFNFEAGSHDTSVITIVLCLYCSIDDMFYVTFILLLNLLQI